MSAPLFILYGLSERGPLKLPKQGGGPNQLIKFDLIILLIYKLYFEAG
jgi:hypothetical protein